jgi:hypothetical protein
MPPSRCFTRRYRRGVGVHVRAELKSLDEAE